MKHFLIIGIYLLATTGISQPLSASGSYDSYLEELPFGMPSIPLPDIPDRQVTLETFGGKPDGEYINTEAFAQAIHYLSESGGGKLVVKAGVWLTGPILLKDRIELHLEKNALVIFTPDFWAYPKREMFFGEESFKQLQSPISAYRASDIAITGEGILDGNGQHWRPFRKNKFTTDEWQRILQREGVLNDAETIWYPMTTDVQHYARREENIIRKYNTPDEWTRLKDYVRPELLHFYGCERVLLQGVTFQNSPFWNLHPELCNDMIIDNIRVRNPWNSQNGDGLDLESCNRVLVVNSTFDVGDDAICLKSGRDEAGRLRGVPTSYVVVKDCTVFHGHGGFVVGSEMSGGVHHIHVSDCRFLNTDTGLRFKSNRQRGGHVHDIHIRDIVMADIGAEPILFDMYYQGHSAVEAMEEGSPATDQQQILPVTEATPRFNSIYIHNISCHGAGRALLFDGLPEQPISEIVLENITIQADRGAILSETERVQMRNVTLHTAEPEALRIYNSRHLRGEGIRCNDRPLEESTRIQGERSRNVILQEQQVVVDTEPFWHQCRKVEEQIARTDFPDVDFNLERYGIRKGKDITRALRQAITDCHRAGGGRVVIPEGIYYTAPIHLLSHVNLHLSKGTELRFSTDPADYLPVAISRWEGIDCQTLSPLIYAYGQENIAVTGEGVLDGQASGDNWWSWRGRGEASGPDGFDKIGKDKLHWFEQNQVPPEQRICGVEDKLSPVFVQFYRCNRILVEEVTLLRSPFWMIHPLMCEDVVVRGVTLQSHGPNNDGIDPESCNRVMIEDCYFDNGDDCIAIKSGRNNDGRKWNIPSSNLIIRNCIMNEGPARGASPTEPSGGCRNVWVENCEMDSPNLDRALRIKSNALRGGLVENFYIRNVQVGVCKQAVLRLELMYERVTEGPYLPEFRNIYLENVSSHRSEYGICIDGFPDKTCVHNLHLINCRLEGITSPDIHLVTGAGDIYLHRTSFNGKEELSAIHH